MSMKTFQKFVRKNMSRVFSTTTINNASARTIFRPSKRRIGWKRLSRARISSDGSDRVAASEGFGRRQKSFFTNALIQISSTPSTKRRRRTRTKASLSSAIIPPSMMINPTDSFGIWAVLLASSHFGLWAEKKPWGASLGGACLISALTTLVLANLGKNVVLSLSLKRTKHLFKVES
jgi:hypothetical protein